MEVVFFSVLTSIWWAASAAVLPLVILLKYNKNCRYKWFSFIYTKLVVPIFQAGMFALRKKAFELLNEKLSGRDVTKPLKVLEIGIASGFNLKFYPENSLLTALDVNDNFYYYFKQNQKKYPQIVYEKTITSAAENMKDIDDCSMDLVIGTYVLCSVTSMKDVLKEIKRVLKPGGKYLFLEHVNYPKSDWGFTIQKFTLPIWTIYGGGCNLTRNSGDVIKNSGFQNVFCEKIFPKSVIFYVRPHIYGLATK